MTPWKMCIAAAGLAAAATLGGCVSDDGYTTSSFSFGVSSGGYYGDPYYGGGFDRRSYRRYCRMNPYGDGCWRFYR